MAHENRETPAPLDRDGTCRAEELLRKREAELRERVKELNCLYAVAKLNADENLSIDQVMQGIVDTLPPAFHYPAQAAAFLRVKDKEYSTRGWTEFGRALESQVLMNGERIGVLAVGYAASRDGREQPFLPEERKLLDAVAEQIGRVLERRLALEELEQSRRHMNLVLEAVADGFWDLNLTTGKEYHSPRWHEMLGYEKGEVEANRDGWFSLVHPEDRPVVLSAEVACNTGQTKFYQAEYRLRTKDQRWIWVQSRGRVVERDPEGRPLRILGIHLDISERRAAEEKARQQTFVQEVVYELSGKIGYTLNYEEVVILILVMLHRAMPFDVAAGFYEKNGAFELILRSSASLGAGMTEEILWRMRKIIADAGGVDLDTDTVQVRTMFMAPERYRTERLDTLGSMLTVPVFRNGREVVGALLVGASEENAFSGDQQEMLASVVNQACLSVDNIHALLSEEEEEQRQLFRSLPLGVLLLSSDNTLVLANDLGRGYLSLFGKVGDASILDSLGGLNMSDILPGPDGGVRRVSMRTQGKDARFFDILAQALGAGPLAGGHVVAMEEVTDRQKAQEAIVASESKFRTLFDHAGDAIFVVSLDGDFLDVNQVACDRLGYSREELLGIGVEGTVKDSRKGNVVERIRLIRRYGSMSFETEHKCKDGTLFPVEINARLIRYEHWLAILAIARDVTERKLAEQAAEEQRGMLAAILDGIKAAFFVVDDSLTVVEANERAQALTGRPVPEMVGKPCSEVLSLDPKHANTAELCALGLDAVLDREVVMVRADGHALPVSLNRIPIIRQGRPHFILACFDISPRKAIERQLTLAQKMDSIGQLAAGIAHEINTPIQFISNNLHFLGEAFTDIEPLLQDRNVSHGGLSDTENTALPDAEGLAYLRREIPQTVRDSLDGVERITSIVMAMKKFSHAMTEEKKELNLNEIVKNTIIVARNEWKYVSEVKTALDENLPNVPLVPGDVDQVVLNLVTNAAHAIGDKVAGTPDKGTITITTRRNGGFAELVVADTGKGIPEENRPKVFNPFFTTKEVGKGTGQGLSIVHGIVVDKLGGEIDFESEAGHGTVFTVRLPLGME